MTVEQAAQELLAYVQTSNVGDSSIRPRVMQALSVAPAFSTTLGRLAPIVGAARTAGFLAGLGIALDFMFQQELLT